VPAVMRSAWTLALDLYARCWAPQGHRPPQLFSAHGPGCRRRRV